MFNAIYADYQTLARCLQQKTLWSDPFFILLLQRLRQSARKHHVIGLPHALRVVQTSFYGIEIDARVSLGRGVWFIHPIGTVLGGNSCVGDACRFFGNNTLGQAKEDGYPVLGNNVWVGAGARILGPIHIGDNAVIAANAVVLRDVPANALAAGVPAKIYAKSTSLEEITRVF